LGGSDGLWSGHREQQTGMSWRPRHRSPLDGLVRSWPRREKHGE
jgi:hypothetical protein